MRGWNTLSSAQGFQGLLLALHYGVTPPGLGGPLEYQGLSAGLLHSSKSEADCFWLREGAAREQDRLMGSRSQRIKLLKGNSFSNQKHCSQGLVKTSNCSKNTLLLAKCLANAKCVPRNGMQWGKHEKNALYQGLNPTSPTPHNMCMHSSSLGYRPWFWTLFWK